MWFPRPGGDASGAIRTRRTVLEDALDVEAVGGARLVKGAASQVGGQFPRPAVVDQPRIVLVDGVCGPASSKRKKNSVKLCKTR